MGDAAVYCKLLEFISLRILLFTLLDQYRSVIEVSHFIAALGLGRCSKSWFSGHLPDSHRSRS